MRYAIYLRKSRADDTSEPLEVTLQRHRQMLEKYMQQHDIAVQDEDVFEEVVSGDSLTRVRKCCVCSKPSKRAHTPAFCAWIYSASGAVPCRTRA